MNSALPPGSLPGFERSLAIVIGINSYSHGIPPLLNAVRDASAVADTLEHQGFEVLRLIDSQASLSALSHLLFHHLPSLQPAPDRLLLYFAGHGLAHTDERHHLAGFLLPTDARRDEPSTYWPMAALRQALGHLSCRHLLLILDCCFAGAFPHASFRDLRAPTLEAPLFLERFRHFSSRRSFQLLLSTSHDELASDRLMAKPSQEALGSGSHSPFARALLEALQPSSSADTNEDGLLTASELYTFLRDRLLTLLPAHAQQTPSLRHMDWHEGGEFLFLLSDSFPSLPSAAPLSKRSNPYLGLRPFTSEHRHLFFGRERLIDSLLERLRSQPLLLLCGPSGAGKSSLVHAGLIPRLKEQPYWLVPPSLRPSSQPVQQLASWLASVCPDVPAPSHEELASEPFLAANFLGSFLSLHPPLSTILVVDPLEELITACSDDSLRSAFLRALAGILHLAHPRLRLILLLRADFEPHFLPLLAPHEISSELWRSSRFVPPSMNRDELRRCIQKPAETSVLFFSSGVVEQLLDDIEQMPGALPLLSVALSELFNAYLDSGREDRTLSFEDYERLGGGIAGALQRRAELIFAGDSVPASDNQPPLPSVPVEALLDVQRTLRNVLLRMVSTEGSELARRRVPRSELDFPTRGENARVQHVLSALESCRLIVATDDGGPCVEPAHDALLFAWPRLHEWARQAQRELLLLQRISHAAAEWLRHRHSFLLWADARLDALDLPPITLQRKEGLIALPVSLPNGEPTRPLILNSSESAFLRASAARQRTLRNRRYAMMLGVAIILLCLTAAGILQAGRASHLASEAEQSEALLVSKAHQAREKAWALQKQKNLTFANARLLRARQLLDQDPTKALLVLQETSLQSDQVPGPWLQLVLEATQRAISTAILVGHERRLNSAAFSPDGRHVLTASGDGTAYIWSSDGQRSPIVLKGHEGWVNSAIFSPDGLRVLTASHDGTARIWRADGQGSPIILRGHSQQVSMAIFSPDGLRVLTASHDGTARIWRSDAQGLPIILRGHVGWVHYASFSPDGMHVVTASHDGTARIWRSDAQGLPIILRGHTKAVYSAAFSSDGSRVVTASWDGTARVWYTNGQGQHITLRGHTKAVNTASFSPDGQNVLTASDDSTARIWRADGHGSPIILQGHKDWVNSATFSPDGSRVLTVSHDGTARIWRTDGQGSPIILQGHIDRVTSGAFSADGSSVVTTSLDLTARVWRVTTQNPPLVLKNQDWRESSFTLSSGSGDPDVLTTADDDSTLICDMNGRPLVTLRDHDNGIKYADFSPDGSHVITFADNSTASIWRSDGRGAPIILRGHEGWVGHATFSPDGSRVLTTDQDGTVRIWRADGQGAPIILRGHEGWVGHATFSPDGSRVLTAGLDGTARIWPADGLDSPLILRGHEGWVTSATFSPNGSRVLTSSLDGTARIWRADNRGSPIILRGHEGWVNSAAFSPDGSRILTLSQDGTARIWRADGLGSPIIFQSDLDWVDSSSFSPDSSRVLTSSGRAALIWRIGVQSIPVFLWGTEGRITYGTFSPDGSRVLTISGDGTARVWSVSGQDAPTVLQERASMITNGTFSPDGSRVLTLSNDNTVRIWPIYGHIPSVPFSPSPWEVRCPIFPPDSSRSDAAAEAGTIRMWRTDGRGISILIDGIVDKVISVTLSPRTSSIIIEFPHWRSVISVTPALLREFFLNTTSACLSPRERVSFLGESSTEANQGYARCNRKTLHDQSF